MIFKTQGWAVIDTDQGIDVRTVCPSRIEAIANWLICGPDLEVSSASDFQIETWWENHKQMKPSLLVGEVTITWED
jgi:hypothetical protein